MEISIAGLSDALRGVPHNLIRILAILFPCGHGRSGCQQKDKLVFHAFRLTERHKSNKRSIGKAQAMLTCVGGGGWIVPTAGPDLVLRHTMSYEIYDIVCLLFHLESPEMFYDWYMTVI